MTSKKKSKKEISASRSMARTAGARARFLIKMAIGLVSLTWAGYSLYGGMDSIAWPYASARLESVSPVSYVFSVNGREFRGSVIRFGDSVFSDSADEMLVPLTAGSMVRAYYNPDYPIMSCLLPGYHKLGVYLPLAFGLFCVAVAGIELRARYLIR